MASGEVNERLKEKEVSSITTEPTENVALETGWDWELTKSDIMKMDTKHCIEPLGPRSEKKMNSAEASFLGSLAWNFGLWNVPLH